MDWVITIAVLAILGLIVGAIAKFLMPGDDPGGIAATSVLGILGAIVGGMIARWLGIGGITGLDWRSLVTALAGSLLLLLVYRAFRMLMPRPASSTYASGRSTSATPLRAFGDAAEYESSSAPNLAEIARESMTNDVVNRLSEKVGESSSAIWKALEAMIPTVLAGMRSQAATPSVAGRLFDLVKGAAHSGLDRHLADGNLEALGRQCQGFLNTLFGDKLAGLLNWLARFAGIKESSASSLMNIASSLVMSTLGRTIQQKGLDASQFASLLSNQSRWLSRLLPSGIGDVPGMRALADLGDRAEVSHATAAGTREGARPERPYRETVRTPRESQLISALLPLALLLLAIPLLGWLMRGSPKIVEPDKEQAARPAPVQSSVAQTPNEPIKRPAPVQPSVVQTSEVRVPEPNRPETTASSTVMPTAHKVNELRLPDGVTLQVPETSFLSPMYKYLTDATATSSGKFIFEGLEFDDAGIRVRPETETAVASLTEMLRAFPSVALRIEGYTDQSADPAADRNWSLARAEALKDMLVKAGVPSNRLTTAGLGSEHPVASNDTAEGRAKNRRIELSLSKWLASPTVIPTAHNVSELRLPDGVTLQVPESSFLSAIYKYLTDATATSSHEFIFEGLEFDDAGIRVRPEIETAVTSLAELLRAFPSVTLRIEGHTNPSGDPATDRNWSLARAEVLKDMLVKAGVPSNRLTTAGLGSEHPVASNDTAEGRAKNRRIELSLSK